LAGQDLHLLGYIFEFQKVILHTNLHSFEPGLSWRTVYPVPRVYDMCKAIDKGIELGPFYLLEKSGGKSGKYVRSRR